MSQEGSRLETRTKVSIGPFPLTSIVPRGSQTKRSRISAQVAGVTGSAFIVRPALGLGISSDEAIWIQHLPWPAYKDLAPEDAEAAFVARVQAWLTEHTLLGTSRVLHEAARA